MSKNEMNKCDLAALETAEERLEQLERRVYGNASKGAHKNEFSTPLIPKLAGMSQDIGDSLGRRERIVPLFRDKYFPQKSKFFRNRLENLESFPN